MASHVVELGADGRPHLQAEDLAAIQPLLPPEPTKEPAAKPKPKANPAKAEPLSVDVLVAQLKARLKVVEREIRNRKALEAERDQIKRLLNAAKAKPATVRAIRAG